MGCFTACFGSGKCSKTRKSSTATLIEDQNICHDREINEVLQCLYSTDEVKITDPVAITSAIIKNDAEEELKSNERKKVAYHADMVMNSSKKELNPLVESDMGQETRKRETSNHEIRLNSNEEEEKSVPAKCKDDEVDAADSSASSLFTYPTNHRYHNCTSSDDESEVTGLKKSDLADEVDGENADDDVDSIDKGNNDDNADIVDSIGEGKNDREGRPFNGVHADIDCIGEGKNEREGRPLVQEESSESLFSLSIDSRKKFFAAEIGEKEVSSPLKPSSIIEMSNQNARNRSQYIHSVLNPIENMSQWRSLKEKTISSLKDQEKENKNLEQETEFSFTEKEILFQELKAPYIEEPIFKNSKQHSMRQTLKEDEIAVDTSLSSWLMASGKSKTNENSPVSVGNSSKRTNSSSRSFDDRPILGALTLDELKQQSRFSAPRRSPNRSPEDTPIIGTVGSYWMHTGQCIELNSNTPSKKTSSKSGQCKEGRMKGNSTTSFQARLERTVNTGSAEA